MTKIHSLHCPSGRIYLRFDDSPGSDLVVTCEEWQGENSRIPYNDQFVPYVPTEKDIHAFPPLDMARFDGFNRSTMLHSHGKILWDDLRRCGWVYLATFETLSQSRSPCFRYNTPFPRFPQVSNAPETPETHDPPMTFGGELHNPPKLPQLKLPCRAYRLCYNETTHEGEQAMKNHEIIQSLMRLRKRYCGGVGAASMTTNTRMARDNAEFRKLIHAVEALIAERDEARQEVMSWISDQACRPGDIDIEYKKRGWEYLRGGTDAPVSPKTSKTSKKGGRR